MIQVIDIVSTADVSGLSDWLTVLAIGKGADY